MIRDSIDTVLGLGRLAWLVMISGFKLRGPYWSWRWHTAFGAGPAPTSRTAWRAILHYARWVQRMHP